MTLMASEKKTYRWPILSEPQVIVGCQREATPNGRRKLNITRSSSMGNPFVLKEHGGDCETAEEATNKYIQWLWPRLRDTSSNEYAWFEQQSERLCSGEKLILGCCGHDHCHGVWIAHLLNTGDWRRWDTVDVEDWCARAIELLVKNWQQFDAFDNKVEPSSLSATDFAAVEARPGRLHDKHAWLITEAEFLDWDNPDPTIKRLYCFTYVLLVAHGPGGERHLTSGTAKSFLNTIKVIKETGEYPQTEEQKLLGAVDQLVADGATPAEILRSAASKGIRNTWNVERYADAARQEQESADAITEAIDRYMDEGEIPEIHLADFFPAKWLPCFRVLKEGLKFKDDVIVATIVCTVGAMLPPTSRVYGRSMTEKVIVWLFLIGSSGTAKSVLLKLLTMQPLQFGVQPLLKALNQRIRKEYAKAVAEYNKASNKLKKKDAPQDMELPKKPEASRAHTVLYTAPTTQGIRADMAETGTFLPSLLMKDELSSWFEEMASAGRQTDMPFYLSAYDGTYSNERFADESKSREVEEGALSVIGGIQPKVFLKFLQVGNENGFNARPLFFQIAREVRELLDSTEDDKKLNIYLGDLYEAAFRLGPVAPMLQTPREWGDVEPLPPPDLNRCPKFWLGKAAEKLFKQAFDELERKSTTAGSDEIEALWAKGPGQLLRWAAPIQIIRNHTGIEPHSDEWYPPEKILPIAEFERIAAVHEGDADAVEHHIRTWYPVISADTIRLALNLVIAGKTQGVDLVERATDPKAQQLRVFLDYVEKHTPKAPVAGVKLSKIFKNAWNSSNRPKRAEINQLAQLAKIRGLVVFVENGTAVRFVR
jgi:hypothetical protein